MTAIAEIFWTFLRLGLVAFGGPVAHLAYFRRWLIDERGWLSDAAYAQIIALAHLLPGPSSSQTGFAIGIQRGGLAGGLAAFIGFTLPSAVIMIALGYGMAQWSGTAEAGWIQGLKLAAIAVVANALYGMARQLCPDAPRLVFAAVAALGASLIPGVGGQILMIVVGAGLALIVLPPPTQSLSVLDSPINRRQGSVLLAVFATVLAASVVVSFQTTALWAVLYQSGALVFGGGHVVLPLLETGLVTPGLIDSEQFLAGYGGAQAIPGPVFSFGGYLGAQIYPNQALLGGLLGLVMIFAPGMLLVAGLMPFWQSLSRYTRVQQALLGINAAVVGLIAAVLWDPLLTAGIASGVDATVAAAALLALAGLRIPVYWVVGGCAVGVELITRLA
jgi:chromate transporter